MKKTLIILLSIILFSCTTRNKNVVQSESFSKTEIKNLINKKIDSISTVLKLDSESVSQKTKNEISNKVVEITSELEAKFDEKGNPIPVSLEEVVNGVIKSKITNIGGKTVYKSYEADNKQNSEIVSIKEILQVLENKFSSSKKEDVSLNSKIDNSKKDLEKKIKSIDFTFGFYVLIGVVAIMSLLLLFFYFQIRNQAKTIKKITDLLPV